MIAWSEIEKLTEHRDTLRWMVYECGRTSRAGELARVQARLNRLVEQWYIEHPGEQDLGDFLADASPC